MRNVQQQSGSLRPLNKYIVANSKDGVNRPIGPSPFCIDFAPALDYFQPRVADP